MGIEGQNLLQLRKPQSWLSPRLQAKDHLQGETGQGLVYKLFSPKCSEVSPFKKLNNLCYVEEGR